MPHTGARGMVKNSEVKNCCKRILFGERFYAHDGAKGLGEGGGGEGVIGVFLMGFIFRLFLF
jgi:hypothetical protein